MIAQGVCPSCGYCPTCGQRKSQQVFGWGGVLGGGNGQLGQYPITGNIPFQSQQCNNDHQGEK